VFINTYGKKQARIWQQRWRIFFMACAELFGYSKGNEWRVAHYLFVKSN
jgi:cyclopropane-fatty-acyl-phospholipid synthase